MMKQVPQSVLGLSKRQIFFSFPLKLVSCHQPTCSCRLATHQTGIVYSLCPPQASGETAPVSLWCWRRDGGMKTTSPSLCIAASRGAKWPGPNIFWYFEKEHFQQADTSLPSINARGWLQRFRESSTAPPKLQLALRPWCQVRLLQTPSLTT